MKRNRSVGKLTDPAKPIQGITLSDEKENKLPVEPNLSPERIMEGASTTTALVNQCNRLKLCRDRNEAPGVS
jgi:hypothetical protein